jgi:diaminopimelate decarboxylase
MVELVGVLRTDGHAISRIDLGGGLGVPYRTDNVPPPDPSEYGALAANITKASGTRLIMEPGRLIAANAGILVSRVIYAKKGEQKDFLIVDAGMNDLVRPSIYGSYHEIQPVSLRDRGSFLADVVGPICESGDFLAKGRMIPKFERGDLVAVMSAGAYGFSMSSNYNSRPRIAEVLVKGKKFHVIRKREDYADLTRGEKVPAYLK